MRQLGGVRGERQLVGAWIIGEGSNFPSPYPNLDGGKGNTPYPPSCLPLLQVASPTPLGRGRGVAAYLGRQLSPYPKI